MNLNIMSGGDLKQKGYEYSFFLQLPTIWFSQDTQYITGGRFRTTTFDFPTSFLLTRNNVYIYTYACVLGFGLGFKISTRS